MDLTNKLFNDLKSAAIDHKKYIADYCDDLCNQIDIESVKKEDELKSNNKLDKTTNDIREQQGLMIKEIKSFQNDCLHNIETKNIDYTNANNIIQDIEQKVKDINDSTDILEINNLNTIIESALMEIEENIFIKKGLIFLSLQNLAEREEDERLKESFLGILLVIQDFFVNKDLLSLIR